MPCFYLQYHDTLTDALSIMDEEITSTPPLILVHAGVYRSENLFIDYNATVIGAGL
jgi:hypothetical protein